MTETEKKGPELRFKGFIDDWEQRKLGDITSKIGSGKTPRGGNSVYTQNGIPLLRSQNIYNDRVNIEDIVYITDSIDKEMANSRVEKNDVLLNITGASIGRSAVYELSSIANVNQHVCIIRPIHEVHSYFVQLNLSSPIGQKQIDLNQAGGGREGLNFQQIAKMGFNFPPFSEQIKIGAFFKKLDNTLALHLDKQQQLALLKKRLLKELFPKDAGDLPHIRFANFNKVWAKSKLIDVAEMFDNLRVPVTASERIQGNIPYYGANGIQDYVAGFTHDGEFVLIAEDGANDLINYPVNYVKGKVWVNNHAHVVSGKKYQLDNLFLAVRIKSMNISPWLVGGGRAKLNGDVLKKILIMFPTYDEQIKIGALFIHLDDTIALHQQRIDQLQSLKKVLLSKMFI